MIHRRERQKVAFILDFLSLSAFQISKFENVIQRVKKKKKGYERPLSLQQHRKCQLLENCIGDQRWKKWAFSLNS